MPNNIRAQHIKLTELADMIAQKSCHEIARSDGFTLYALTIKEQAFVAQRGFLVQCAISGECYEIRAGVVPVLLPQQAA